MRIFQRIAKILRGQRNVAGERSSAGRCGESIFSPLAYTSSQCAIRADPPGAPAHHLVSAHVDFIRLIRRLWRRDIQFMTCWDINSPNHCLKCSGWLINSTSSHAVYPSLAAERPQDEREWNIRIAVVVAAQFTLQHIIGNPLISSRVFGARKPTE